MRKLLMVLVMPLAIVFAYCKLAKAVGDTLVEFAWRKKF